MDVKLKAKHRDGAVVNHVAWGLKNPNCKMSIEDLQAALSNMGQL
jgi:hypothetical protein